ncbi:MAG: prohibitin family protein [Spirochaetes bacterium]|nr:prohibitin family protein [Spirochaetota bacterium]
MAQTRVSEKTKKLIIMWIFIFIAFLIFLAIAKPFIIVGAGERAVIFNRLTGIEERQLTPGFNILVPFIQKPIIYDVRNQTYTMSGISTEGQYLGDDSIQALTSDGQPVGLELSVIYRIDDTQVWRLHEEIGPNFVEKILRPSIRETVRTVVSRYSVIELFSSNWIDIARTRGFDMEEEPEEGELVGRELVQMDMEETLKIKLGDKYLIVDTVLLRNVRFSEEYRQAIERKQVAQQEAERMKYVLEKAEKEKEEKIIIADGDKQAAVIRAEGEAQAIKLKGESLRQNPAVINYEYVQKISPNVKTIITDGKSIMSIGDIFRDQPSK